MRATSCINVMDLVAILDKYKEVGTMSFMMHKKALSKQPKRKEVDQVIKQLKESIKRDADRQ
ncbi:hypothetical protein PAPYR_8567 [Paratrimastix pyriformis]|uniref:Uncharacterized protein n=1 Tax=Paratrimastix pyriformis TaxID=342808 RepID=A0ABQ8UEI2_9EUKA|nr:hypothetical protein PAPYR_8567 [Paratrimastix pyriformis]